MNLNVFLLVFAVVSVEAGLLNPLNIFDHSKSKQNGTKSPNHWVFNSKLREINEEVRHTNDDVDFSVQSPISITSSSCNNITNVNRLKYYGHWEKDGQACIEDTGTSAKITFEHRMRQPFISGGLLNHNERYIFEQMHLHWGEHDDVGSEHVIDGKSYSMEAHLVHFNEKYGNFDTAINMKDGLVVIAFLIQASGNEKNTLFAKITDQIQNIQELHSKTYIKTDCLRWMSLQELDRNYFTYHGSLTTPPYNESVTWIIYPTPVIVSKQQVAVFRNIRSADNIHKITKNCRALQISSKRPTVTFVGSP